LAAYRSHARWILAAFFGPFMLLGVAGLFVVGHPGAWAAGVVVGAGAGAVLALRDSPPEYVDKWRRGAEGERKTARALRRLDGSRWTVVHDVDAGRGNYDHIVVGPAGMRLGKCTLVRGNALRPWLLQQDAKLDQTSVARLSAAVEALAAGTQTMVR
jgi:hypothetical protein